MKVKLIQLILKALVHGIPFFWQWANQWVQYIFKKYYYRGRYWKYYINKKKHNKNESN